MLLVVSYSIYKRSFTDKNFNGVNYKKNRLLLTKLGCFINNASRGTFPVFDCDLI